jgi:hypothetical protein
MNLPENERRQFEENWYTDAAQIDLTRTYTRKEMQRALPPRADVYMGLISKKGNKYSYMKLDDGDAGFVAQAQLSSYCDSLIFRSADWKSKLIFSLMCGGPKAFHFRAAPDGKLVLEVGEHREWDTPPVIEEGAGKLEPSSAYNHRDQAPYRKYYDDWNIYRNARDFYRAAAFCFQGSDRDLVTEASKVVCEVLWRLEYHPCHPPDYTDFKHSSKTFVVLWNIFGGELKLYVGPKGIIVYDKTQFYKLFTDVRVCNVNQIVGKLTRILTLLSLK